MQASKMARLVASLPAGVEGTLFPQRRPAAGGRCRSAVVQPALPCTPELRKGLRQGREGGQGGVWGRQREGGAVGRQGPAGSLGLARTGRLPAAAASVLVQGGPSRGQTAGAAVQPAVGLQPSLQSGPQPSAAPWQQPMASAAPPPALPRSCPPCPISWPRPTCAGYWRRTGTSPHLPSVGPRPPPWRPPAPPSPPAHHTPSLTHVCSESLPTTHGCWARRGCPQGCPLPCWPSPRMQCVGGTPPVTRWLQGEGLDKGSRPPPRCSARRIGSHQGIEKLVQ